jgi:hypothetical protein
MRLHRTTVGALLAGTALLTASAAVAPASAVAEARLAHAPSALLLTISDPVAGARTTELFCDPPGGSHPAAGAACPDHSRAGGPIDEQPGDSRHPYCPMMYRPVTASAKGNWRGQPVTFTSTYPNGCVLTQRTGPVFQF